MAEDVEAREGGLLVDVRQRQDEVRAAGQTSEVATDQRPKFGGSSLFVEAKFRSPK